MVELNKQDKIFIEKAQKVRLIIQQGIGLSKVIDKVREEYQVKEFVLDDEEIILIEEKK